MAHTKDKKIDWNRDIIYKDEQHFLQAHKDAGSEIPIDELKDAYKTHYAKAEKPADSKK
jgi:hypothetical protein